MLPPIPDAIQVDLMVPEEAMNYMQWFVALNYQRRGSLFS